MSIRSCKLSRLNTGYRKKHRRFYGVQKWRELCVGTRWRWGFVFEIRMWSSPSRWPILWKRRLWGLKWGSILHIQKNKLEGEPPCTDLNVSFVFAFNDFCCVCWWGYLRENISFWQDLAKLTLSKSCVLSCCDHFFFPGRSSNTRAPEQDAKAKENLCHCQFTVRRKFPCGPTSAHCTYCSFSHYRL